MVKEHITHMGGECVNRRQARLVESAEKEKNEDPDFIKEFLDLYDKCELPPLCVARVCVFLCMFLFFEVKTRYQLSMRHSYVDLDLIRRGIW
jgi:hypothetical protein